MRDAGQGLAEAVREAMYAEDPFWIARYGQRGMQYATSDGHYHVKYLAESLESGDLRHLVGYARWLQSVLVTRGMCTRHLEDNFTRLADAIEREALPDAAIASAFLHEAANALVPGGDAGEIYEAAQDLADAAVRLLPDPPTPADAEAVAFDVERLVAYVADAMASDRDDLLVAHLRWAVGVHGGQGRSGLPAAFLVQGLLAALAARSDAPAHAAHARLADAARAMAGAGPFGAAP